MQRSKKLHWCCVRLPGDEQKRCSYETDYGKTSIFQNPKCQSSTWFHFIMHSCRNAHFLAIVENGEFGHLRARRCTAKFSLSKIHMGRKNVFFCKCLPLASKSNRQKENLKQNFFCTVLQYDLPPLRPHCGEAPCRESNPGRADLVAGTL